LIIGIIIVIALVSLVLFNKKSELGLGDPGGDQLVGENEEIYKTRTAAPGNVKIPEQGEEASGDVAVPQIVSQTGIGSSVRTFDIRIEDNEFKPSEIIVNYLDVVRINITAVDRNYDLSQADYGLKIQLAKGQTRMVEFQANVTGKLTLYCASCGGPDKGPIGYLIVVQK